MKKEYCVYEHVFPDGTKYVGITNQKPESRWGTNGWGYYEQPVYQAITFWGWDNIEHNIIASGLTQEEARELEQKIIHDENLEVDGWNRHKGGGVGGSPIPMFWYKDKLMTSEELAEYATAEGITGHDLTTRINHWGWDIETALSKPKIVKGTKYEYRGGWYTTDELAKLSPIEGMTTGHISTRLAHHGWDVERAVNQPLNVKLQPKGIGERIYEYQGKMYNSYELTQISPIKGLDIGELTCRINHHGWSVERAITTPLKRKNIQFEYNGKNYDSHELAEIAVDPSMTYHDVTDRARSGWTTWEIVNIPKGITKKRFYKTHKDETYANSQPSQENSNNSILEGSETNA